MPNPHRGEHEIEIGGEQRTFRYSLNKLANIEEKLGVSSINELMESLRTNLSFALLRYLIWVGIAEYDPKAKEWSGPTEEEVGDWQIDIEHVSRQIRIALFRAFRGGKSIDEPLDEEEGAPADAGPPAASSPTEEESTTPG